MRQNIKSQVERMNRRGGDAFVKKGFENWIDG